MVAVKTTKTNNFMHKKTGYYLNSNRFFIVNFLFAIQGNIFYEYNNPG